MGWDDTNFLKPQVLLILKNEIITHHIILLCCVITIVQIINTGKERHRGRWDEYYVVRVIMKLKKIVSAKCWKIFNVTYLSPGCLSKVISRKSLTYSNLFSVCTSVSRHFLVQTRKYRSFCLQRCGFKFEKGENNKWDKKYTQCFGAAQTHKTCKSYMSVIMSLWSLQQLWEAVLQHSSAFS